MTFLAPGFLWLCLPLGLLFWWRLRNHGRQRETVSTMVIWQKLAAESSARGRRHKVWPLDVFLEALGALTLVLWLAGVGLAWPVAGPGLLIVQDSGGAMKPAQRQREAAAIAEVLAAEAGGESTILSFPADDAWTGTTFDWGNALQAEGPPGFGIHLVTDRLPALPLPADWGFSFVTEEIDNVGITAVDAKSLVDGKIQVFVALAGSKSRLQRPLRLVVRNAYDEEVHQRTLKLSAQGLTSVDFVVRGHKSRQLSIALDINDDLAADNEVVLTRPANTGLVVVEPALMELGVEPALLTAFRALEFETVRVGDVPAGPRVALELAKSEARGLSTKALIVLSKGGPGFTAKRSLPGVDLGSAPAIWHRPTLSRLPAIEALSLGDGSYFDLDPAAADLEVLASQNGRPLLLLEGQSRLHFAGNPERWGEDATFPLVVRELLALIGLTTAPSLSGHWQVAKGTLDDAETLGLLDKGIEKQAYGVDPARRDLRSALVVLTLLVLALLGFRHRLTPKHRVDPNIGTQFRG